MGDVVFNCPECKNSLIVDGAGCGIVVPCPLCSVPIEIPVDAIPLEDYTGPPLNVNEQGAVSELAQAAPSDLVSEDLLIKWTQCLDSLGRLENKLLLSGDLTEGASGHSPLAASSVPLKIPELSKAMGELQKRIESFLPHADAQWHELKDLRSTVETLEAQHQLSASKAFAPPQPSTHTTAMEAFYEEGPEFPLALVAPPHLPSDSQKPLPSALFAWRNWLAMIMVLFVVAILLFFALSNTHNRFFEIASTRHAPPPAPESLVMKMGERTDVGGVFLQVLRTVPSPDEPSMLQIEALLEIPSGHPEVFLAYLWGRTWLEDEKGHRAPVWRDLSLPDESGAPDAIGPGEAVNLVLKFDIRGLQGDQWSWHSRPGIWLADKDQSLTPLLKRPLRMVFQRPADPRPGNPLNKS